MATRRERVVLDLQDNFTPGMARAAAATALLNRELNSLSGQSLATARSSQTFSRDIQRIGNEANGAGSSINQLTGRLRLLGEALAILGPAAGPLGAAGIAGIGGLAAQMGAAAIAGGVLIGSLQGVGDALGAMNKAQLEPTEKNLQAAEEALKRLSPAAREFSEAAFDLKPALVAIRDIGSEALMPGLTESLQSLETLGPRAAGIFQSIAGALGDVARDSSASLASDRWAGFFEFIEREIPDAITELATTVGSLTHGMVELWEAFTPLNDDFSSWLMNAAAGFDAWATGLSATEGFAEFIDYVRTTGPQLADTLGAIANAVVQIVQATAPLGGPVLAAIEGFAKAVGAIADSDLGTPIFAGVAALAALNRALAVTSSLSKTSLSGGLFAGLGTVATGAQKGAGGLKGLSGDIGVLARNYKTAGTASERMAAQNAKALGNLKETGAVAGKAAGALGGLAVVTTGAADGLGLTNTASLALMGTLGGPVGVGLGAAAGLFLDWRASIGAADEQLRQFEATVSTMSVDELTAGIAEAEAKLAAVGSDSMAGGLLAERIDVAKDALRELSEAEGIANAEARGAALAFLAQTDANVDLGKWAGKSTEQIKAQADAIKATREEADQTARSFVGLGDSLDDSKTSLGQWIRDMASTADALNNFTNNSRRAAKRGLDDGLIRSLQAAGEQGALRMRQLANGTKGSIDEANAAFRKGEKAIERYNNYKVPPKVVKADVSNAMSGFLGVDRYLSSLDGKTATTYVNTVRTVTGPQGAAVFGQQADGGTIEGPRQPYGDKMLYLLAPGEEVISNRNGQADRHRSLLKAINGGLADGGTSGKKGDKRKFSGGEFVTDNTAALEQAIRSLTSVAEDQTRAVEDSTRKTDLWADKMSDVAQATVAGFSTALFETRDIAGSSNPWAAGAMGARTEGGWLENLTKDISGLQTRSGLQSQLAGMGLSGDALAALLSEGTNEDISGLINSGGVSQYASLYSQRSALQQSVGASAGQQAFGREHAESLAVQNRNAAAAEATQASIAQLQRLAERQAAATERIEQNAPERTGAAVGAAVNGPAKSAAIGGPTKPGKPK